MSRFEDYSEVSKSYDKGRTVVGADIIAGLVQVHTGEQLKDIHLLDAGCGTGNYSKALIDYGVGKISLVDGCPEMLNVAKGKLIDAIAKKVIDKAEICKLPDLPFNDGSFDAILFSLVLHHLDGTVNGHEFPVIQKVFHEAKRVLRPRGVMIIGTTFPEAVRKALWYYQVNMGLGERYSKIYPSLEQLESMCTNSGFKISTKTSVLGTELISNYFDAKGPLKEEWRKADSFFGFATKEELEDVKQKVQEMNDNGTINQFIQEHDRTSEIGMLTILLCTSL